MILLIKLLLAHLIADFMLQPQSWVLEKEVKKAKSLKLYLHIAIHIVVMSLIVWDVSKIPVILVIAIITISIKNSGNDGRTRQLLQKINITDHKIARKLLKAKGFKIPTNHWRRDVI